MTKKVGIIGSGQVAQSLAAGFLKNGYAVMMGSRSPEKLDDWRKKSGTHAQTGTFSEAAAFGSLVVLAVKGSVAEEAVKLADGSNLAGKTVIDVTNPIADRAPENGVLQFFTGPNDSLMERLQKQVPGAHWVKAFSCIGNVYMVDPDFPSGTPTMFICGNDAKAKEEVKTVLHAFGWNSIADMGGVEAARAIEPLCMLWCIPGFNHNSWNHAFSMITA